MPTSAVICLLPIWRLGLPVVISIIEPVLVYMLTQPPYFGLCTEYVRNDFCVDTPDSIPEFRSSGASVPRFLPQPHS